MTLQDIILQYVPLSSSRSKNGWQQTLCKVCNDHGKKGLRAGFRFNGDEISYNCFNCGATGYYQDNSIYRMSDDMKRVMLAFGVPEDTIKELDFESFQRRQTGQAPTVKQKEQTIKYEPKELSLPSFFKPLDSFDPEYKWRLIAEDHLIETRKLDPAAYQYFLADPDSDSPFVSKWIGRLIIPVYKDDKLIFWQGRDLTNTRVNKYMSPSDNKHNVLFGFEHLHEDTDTPLYIVESIFDAMHLNGVAILGKTLTDEQLAMLQRSRRQKVYIPDRYGDGFWAAEKALKAGWSISTPDIGDQKDITEAIAKYGKLYVLRSLAENICDGATAEMRLPLYCIDYHDKKRRNKKGKKSSRTV